MAEKVINYKHDGRYHQNKGVFTITNPTNNCQLFSISNFQNLLSGNKEECVEGLKELFGPSNVYLNGKQLMLCDVRRDDYQIVKNFFKEHIVKHTPYKSSNNSKMVLVIINISKI